MMLRINELCKSKDITINDLAVKKLGITKQELYASINNPSLNHLYKIAAALDVEIVELFKDRGDFVAFVRNQGIDTFDLVKTLKEYVDAQHKLVDIFRKFGEAIDKIKLKHLH